MGPYGVHRRSIGDKREGPYVPYGPLGPMDPLWTPCGPPMDLIWTLYGPPVDHLWIIWTIMDPLKPLYLWTPRRTRYGPPLPDHEEVAEAVLHGHVMERSWVSEGGSIGGVHRGGGGLIGGP